MSGYSDTEIQQGPTRVLDPAGDSVLCTSTTVRIDRTPQLSNPSEVRLNTTFYHSTNQSSPPQSTHRVAIADFWRTSHHDGKISPGWWGWGMHGARPPPLSLLPSRTKLQCTLLPREQIQSLCFISTFFVLCALPPPPHPAKLGRTPVRLGTLIVNLCGHSRLCSQLIP